MNKNGKGLIFLSLLLFFCFSLFVNAAHTTTVSVSGKSPANRSWTFTAGKDQKIRWEGYMKTPDPGGWGDIFSETIVAGIFYIRDITVNSYLAGPISRGYDKYWSSSGERQLYKGHRYLVFVQRHRLKINRPGDSYYKHGTTWAKITFYDEPTLTPVTPKPLDQNGDTIYYPSITELKWNYSDPQGLAQRQVNIVVQKINSSGSWESFIETGNMNNTAKNYSVDNNQFDTGAYKWRIKGYNSKIWSDYSSWQSFYIDKLPPWPANGFSFDASLNLTKETEEATVRDVYTRDDNLVYTLEWNKFVDTDESNPVGSGVKEQLLQYSKDGEEWQELSHTGSDQSAFNFSVEWSSEYKFRIKAEDNVANGSEWYPLESNFPEFHTPSKPTEFKDIQYLDGDLDLEFYIHDFANAYQIKWRNTADESINGETEWITVPEGYSAETFTYRLLDEDFDFRYNDEYEFTIATCNTVDDELIVYNDPTPFQVLNQPPMEPGLQGPEDGSYFTTAGLSLSGGKTTDPDGHQLTYTFVLEKRAGTEQLEWIEYGEYSTVVTDSGVKADITLENGHYRWRLRAFDGIDSSYSPYRELFVDTSPPKIPVFHFQSESGDLIDSSKQSQIVIFLEDYSKEYEQYPYPEDGDRLNDVESFEISSNLDQTVPVNKLDLMDDRFTYNIEPVNGVHEITVRSYDQAGNSTPYTRTLVFDNKQPGAIAFSEAADTYLHNSIDLNTGPEVEFNWPDAGDNPTEVSNSGIEKYIIEIERPDSGSIELKESSSSSFVIDNLNYNEAIRLKVKAVDGAGNEGQWSEELSWFTAAEPTGLVVDEGIEITEIEDKDGLYQKSVDLLIEPSASQYYKIHRLNLSSPDEEELISGAVDNSTLEYSQPVEAHQDYRYFVKTYNQLDQSTDGSLYDMTTEIYIANSLPTVPQITISGVNENQYLNTDSTVINIGSVDKFGKRFEHCLDYDNDNLTYQYIVREDGEIIVNEEDGNASLSMSDLKEGSSYEVQVRVTDSIPDEDGNINYVSSDLYQFTVDSGEPEIRMTVPDDNYVAEKLITIDATDAISRVASIKYRWNEDGETKVLADNRQIEAPHGDNKLILTAVDNAGNEVSVSSVYRVDTTAPEIAAVQLQDTQQYNGNLYITDQSGVYVELDLDEDLTNIVSYHYGLVEESEAIENISVDDLFKKGVNSINGYRGEQFIPAELQDGGKYYPVIMATNSVGRTTTIQKVEPGFYVDASAPEININIQGLVDNQHGRFLTDIDSITVGSDIEDQESGIREIYYGIPGDLNSDKDWYDSIDDLKASAVLNEGESYYLAVKAVNNLGLSDTYYSEGFIVDTVKPQFMRLTGGRELPDNMDSYIQRRNDYLKASWTVDDISLIDRYYYKIGTEGGRGNISREFAGADDEGWIEYSSNAYQESLTVSKSNYTFPDGIYYLTIKAVDEAGNESTATTNGIEINTQLSPVPTIKTDSLYLNRRDYLHFIIEMQNPEQEISGYKYWLGDSGGNTILASKEIDTDKEIIDIEESDLTLQDGEDYYIYARVRYIDGSYSDSGFAELKIDSTPPSILNISSPDYASERELSLSWNGEEDYSEIWYQLKIGTEMNSGNILDWTDVGGKQQQTFNDLELADNQVIYITLRAVNSAGLSDIKVSEPVVIDNTAPPVPVVIDEGLYSNDNTKLSVDWRWTTADQESGRGTYQTALLTSRNINENTDWIEVAAGETNYTFKQQLTNGRKYYLAVKAVNGAGIASTGISDGIVIDTTKPEPPEIDDHGDYTDSLNSLQGTFNGSLDPESGIASFYYSLGTYKQPSELVDDREVESTAVGGNNFNLQIGEVYFFEATAKNNAGLLSARTRSNGIKVVEPDRPEVVRIEDGGDFSINNRALSFVWMLDDTAIPSAYFEYALLDSQEAGIDEWSRTDRKQITLNAEDIYGQGGVYEDGKTYYLAVRAVNMLGNPTAVKISDGITVDSTPPTGAVLGIDNYTNKNFDIKWNCTDPDTKITGYKYAVGSSRGGTELTGGWKYIDVNQINDRESSERIDRTISLDVKHGGRYYLTVQAVNEAGLWSMPAESSVIVADLEDPVTPLVSTESRLTPGYVNSKTIIENIEFSTEDTLSGIAGYRYQVVDNTDLSTDLSGDIEYTDGFFKVFTKEDLDIGGLSLAENGRYYVAVQSVDRTGNWSDTGYSQPIIVDTIKPTLGFKTELDELVTNDGIQEIGWSTSEGGTIYYRTVPLDENGIPLDDPQFTEELIGNYTGDFKISLAEYGRYSFEIYQIDPAGNITDPIDQIVRYNQPPVVSIAGEPSAYKGRSITFRGQVTDDTGLDRFIWRIDGHEEIKSVATDNDPAEFTYQFLKTGDYQLELEVYDLDGVSTIETKDITITNTLKGKLISDETWSGKMEMQGTVEVPREIKLTLEPGTEVSFPESSYLLVRGNPVIDGTLDNPIKLTGTYWSGLLITETAELDKLNYLEISNAERGLTLENQDITIANSSFIGNGIGIHLHGSSPEINSCEISQNKFYGVKEELDSIPVLINNLFKENGNDYYHQILTNISIEYLNSIDGNSGNRGQ